MGAIIMQSAPWWLDVFAVAFVLLLVAALDLLVLALCCSAAQGDAEIRAAIERRRRVEAPLEPLNLGRARRRQVAARRRSRVS